MSYLSPCHLICHYFFSAWNFLFVRCLVLCFSLLYFRCIVFYCSYLCCFAFYFTVKAALFSTLNSRTFFFQRENPSLFFIKFLNKTRSLDVAALLFCALYFSFSSWKPLSVPYWFRLIYALLLSMRLSFLFAWNFLSISSVKTLYSNILTLYRHLLCLAILFYSRENHSLFSLRNSSPLS